MDEPILAEFVLHNLMGCCCHYIQPSQIYKKFCLHIHMWFKVHAFIVTTETHKMKLLSRDTKSILKWNFFVLFWPLRHYLMQSLMKQFRGWRLYCIKYISSHLKKVSFILWAFWIITLPKSVDVNRVFELGALTLDWAEKLQSPSRIMFCHGQYCEPNDLCACVCVCVF